MYDACHQQPQAGFSLVGDMHSQSQLNDLIIIVTNKCVRPRPKSESDPWDAAGELHCTVFAAVDSVGRPLIVRTVARPEDWNQPWARQHPNNKEYWPPVQSQTGRPTVVNSLRSLVVNNRLIVGWDTSFDLASLDIGVSSTMMVNLATDPEVRQCLLQHMGRGVENRYRPLLDDFPGCLFLSHYRWKRFRIDK